ncbi:MAG: hypothetical protein GEU71_04660 [Actinobacteria bacterium]|nr:hypothetical protein [Actinomycetota bacterium]
MSMTEIDSGTKLDELREELRTISPEVVAGDAKAKKTATELRGRIKELEKVFEEEKQLRQDAAIEGQRRAAEEARRRDLEERDKARRDFADTLAGVVEIDREITDLLDQLKQRVVAYRDSAASLIRLSARAADPKFNLTRGKLEGQLTKHLEASLKVILIGSRQHKDRRIRPFGEAHTAWLEKVKASLSPVRGPAEKKGDV